MMARPFSSKNAKQLIRQQADLQEKLESALTEIDDFKAKIYHWAERLSARETLKVLRDIPVEELNRDKKGIRVKTLRENGYSTIADVATSTVYQLAAISGISEEGARTIKRIAAALSSKASQDLKIHLSLDNKTEEAGELLLAILKYQKGLAYKKECQSLLFKYADKVEKAIKDLSIARSSFHWFFASKTKKQAAQVAYAYLQRLLNSQDHNEAETILTKLSQIKALSVDFAWQKFGENPITFTNALDSYVPGLLGTRDTSYGLPEDLAREIQDECFFPDGLLCQLRTYQEWGVKFALHQEKVLLGDEMGLGKTIQAIATMVSLKNTGATHFMVIAPAGVLTNWYREICKHSKLRAIKVHGVNREAAFEEWLKLGGVAVTTYETCAYLRLAVDFRFTLLVVDEAHYIKNKAAKRTAHVKELAAHAERLLFMTGTALENRVDEMISLLALLRPDIADSVRGLKSLVSAPIFRKKIAPVYLRRKRNDVLKELPELIETKEWCNLKTEEERIYEASVLAKKFNEARRVSWNIADLHCSAKACRMLEIIEAAEEDERKVIVFSFFLTTIRKIADLLGKRCLQPLTGAVAPQRRQEIIDEFAQAPPGTVLLAQIQAGGTGLNIQSANVVIICEPQLKPSIENQAISRAYRLGQSRNVLVYRLLAEDTVDEKISDLLAGKQKIFERFADKSAAAENIEIDQQSFDNIITEEITRIKAKQSKTLNI